MSEYDDEISEEELREISQNLSDAQDEYENLSFLAMDKIPCPECGGKGSQYGGILGNYCPRCENAGFVPHPGSEDFEMPDFSTMRAQLSSYGVVLADRALPKGHRCKKNLALPPPGPVRDVAKQVASLSAEAKEIGKRLAAAGKDAPQLAPASPTRNQLGGSDLSDGIGDTPSDDDLDALERAGKDSQ